MALSAIQKAYVADTLIGVIKSFEDYIAFRTEYWYRIPVDKAPKIVSEGNLKYVALFQSGEEFKDKKSTILFYGVVKSIEQKTRKELNVKSSGDPDKLYFKINFSEINRLAMPINNTKGMRLTFLTTTFKLLTSSRELDELTL